MQATSRSLLDRASSGVVRALAEALTHVEQDDEIGQDLLRLATARAGSGAVIGVTGPPGAGKSSLVSELINAWRTAGSSVGVVAVDPSSPFTGGAVLGDRIRMLGHSLDEAVFVRSLATRGQLGGLAAAASSSAAVLRAVGFDHVVLETVGVGQAELAIADSADTTVVVVNPGWGDAVQASKAGVLEIADVLVVNKADRQGADTCKAELESMLEMAAGRDGWVPPVILTSAAQRWGVDELREAIERHATHLTSSGVGEVRRRARRQRDLTATVMSLLREAVDHDLGGPMGAEIARRAIDGEVDVCTAAHSIARRLTSGATPLSGAPGEESAEAAQASMDH